LALLSAAAVPPSPEFAAGNQLFGHDERLGRHGLFNNSLRSPQILFHQERRDTQHVADVIEPVAGIVCREFIGGIEVDSH
jgi:hypothetical protein